MKSQIALFDGNIMPDLGQQIALGEDFAWP
jgi:hypothetical protein